MIIIAVFKMARRRLHTPAQLELRPRTWGGKREGAGRKPTGQAGVAHGRREPFASRCPLHVTLRLRAEVGALRRHRVFSVLREALRAGSDRNGFRLCQFNVLGNHMHLLCEATKVQVLSRGVQGLEVRIARSLNRTLGRSGRVFQDRFHMRVLRTPSEVRTALVYVLQNQRKHSSARVAADWFDPYSSAPWFDGWSQPLPTHEPWMREALATSPCVARAHTWLLTAGWRVKRGPLSLAHGPVGSR